MVGKGLFRIEDAFRRLPVSDFWHPVIGAVGFSAVGLLVPRALGVGYDAIGDVLNDRLTVTAIAVLALAKLARDYQIMLPLMLAAVVADVIAAALMHETLMTEKLARRGLRVQTEYEVDVLRTTLVRDVMTREVDTLPAAVSVGEARARLLAGRHSAYPLVDGEGRCVGVLARGDFLRQASDAAAPVAGIASGDVVAVSPDDTVFRALQLILEEGVEHLPVLEDGRLAGICTRTDVLRARRRQLDLERRQPGWSFGTGTAREI